MLSADACSQGTKARRNEKTRPEGYMRTLITVKLFDRFLLEHASEYDEDLLEFEPESEAEEIAV